MSIETATLHARELLAADAPDCHDPLDFDLRLRLMRDHQITNHAAENIIDRVRAEESARLAAMYRKAAKKGRKK